MSATTSHPPAVPARRTGRSQPPPGSLGFALERQRLAHRERRLTAVVRTLRSHRATAPSPGINAALADFEDELRRIRARLERAAHPRGGPRRDDP